MSFVSFVTKYRDHRPITLPVEEVDKMHFVSAIVTVPQISLSIVLGTETIFNPIAANLAAVFCVPLPPIHFLIITSFL